MEEYPIVKVTDFSIVQNCFVVDKQSWDIPTLFQFCKEKGYKPFSMPLAVMDLRIEAWGIKTLSDFLYEMKRTTECDLTYPIIFDSKGTLCDGLHRICKAILNGDTYIQAIRMMEMPPPSNSNFNQEL